MVDADLEGVAAKHLAYAYHPKLARWHKVLNRAYTQRQGRAEWFERQERYGKARRSGGSGRIGTRR